MRDYFPHTQAIFLYCEASYPARHVDTRKIRVLAEIFDEPFGFSDHTTDVYEAPLNAQRNGAVILEKHFNPFDYTDTPDAPHALNIRQFQLMVKALKGEDPVLGPSPDEMPITITVLR